MRYVVDIETTSACDLAACGASKYAKDDSTRILCVAWADADSDSEPQLWNGHTDDPETLAIILDMFALKADLLIAHNAAFERACLREYITRLSDPSSAVLRAVRTRCGRRAILSGFQMNSKKTRGASVC